jgi:hypothetical protein
MSPLSLERIVPLVIGIDRRSCKRNGRNGYRLTTERERAVHEPVTWTAAAQATLHRLAGRAIGEVLGMAGVPFRQALKAAFVVTTPVTRCLMGRGKGHAVAHTYH